jgi:hypothetical protein
MKSRLMPKLSSMLILTVFAVTAGTAAAAAEPAAKPGSKPPAQAQSTMAAEARIPFANHGGIYSWQVENDRSLLIQSQGGKWYRATLFSSCFDLPFSETVGFETDSSGSFDKFSSIRVRGQTCRLSSLVQTAAPEKNKKAPAKPVARPAAKSAEPG